MALALTEKSLSTKMAETPDQVLGFLNDLAVKPKPQGEREVEELRQFAEKEPVSLS
ncbi:M3 family metallopeptidase [Vibrio lentus]|nr:M3 family metallopeptidase [Vibrio lentus]